MTFNFTDASRGFLPAPPGVAGAGSVTSVAATDGTITISGTPTVTPTVGVALGGTFAWTGTHSWATTDAGTTSVTTQTTISQHRSSGTPAAGFGAGTLFALDSSNNTLRTAAEIDAVWSTATNAAEVSSLAFKTMLAGTLTEVFRVGTGATLPDSDVSFSLGRALIDSRSTDTACFSHRDHSGTTAYALKQTATGASAVGCASGQSLVLTYNNTTRVSLNSTGIGFFGAAAVAQQALSGSRGGNAAVASIATALANLGLCTDGTTA